MLRRSRRSRPSEAAPSRAIDELPTENSERAERVGKTHTASHARMSSVATSPRRARPSDGYHTEAGAVFLHRQGAAPLR